MENKIKTKILIINGPNLKNIEKRDNKIYGSNTTEELEKMIEPVYFSEVMIDISAGGIRFTTEEHFRMGDFVFLKFAVLAHMICFRHTVILLLFLLKASVSILRDHPDIGYTPTL